MNFVCTYWEDLKDGRPRPTPLIELWAESWTKRGWTPVVLGRAHAETSPLFPTVYEAAMKQPSVNSIAYSTANKIRYCAMHAVGGGLLVDYDVINYSFTPDKLPALVDGRPLVRLHCGGFIAMTADGAAGFCETIAGWNKGFHRCSMWDGRPHLSDLCIHQYSKTPWVPGICISYSMTKWETFPTVHYSNHSTGGVSGKADFIQSVKPV